MMNQISALIASIRLTLDVAQGIYSLSKSVEINQKILPLLEMIRTIEKDALRMESHIRKLEEENETQRKKLMEFLKWEETEKQYELQPIAFGILLHGKKVVIKSTETIQWACPKCWHNHIEQPLHPKYHTKETGSYSCPNCDKIIEWNHSKPLGHEKLVEMFVPRIGNKK
jgi:predicted RNA-binding Zn-ribbon protein involved in translation (DUF1610 family)